MSSEHLKSFLDPEPESWQEELMAATLSISGAALIIGSAIFLPLRSPWRPALTFLGIVGNAIALTDYYGQYKRAAYRQILEEKRLEFAQAAAEADFAAAFQPPQRPAQNTALPPSTAEAIAPSPSLFDWRRFDTNPDRYAHIAIIGATGDGKSTLAEALAHQLEGAVFAIAPHWKPGDFPGIPVFCAGRNYSNGDDSPLSWIDVESGWVQEPPSVVQVIEALLEECDRRYQLREKGDESYGFINLIWDEALAALDEAPELGRPLISLLREARKVKIRLILLLQSDDVASLKIKGRGAVRSCLSYVRLGDFAIKHSSKLSLPQEQLEWLQNQQFPCLVEWFPAQFPQVPARFPLGSQGTPEPVTRNHPEPTGYQRFQPAPEPPGTGYAEPPEPPGTDEDRLRNQAQKLLASGYSKSRIIKEIWGLDGRKYKQGQALWDSLNLGD
ncbi:hypothetical protein [Sodalinema gerasimenkoae]|uniref:hypothetical protein n=1 Tax=Sodalinema gerasimenkoae TaxID=2862348 RepID=UPI001356C7A5|nr:hypothetical protein [Sodalinema gerasimenkoae]